MTKTMMIKIPTVEGDLGADDHAVNMITTMTTIWLKQQQHDYNDNNMITVTTTWELQERQQYDHNHNTCWGCTDTCPCIWTGGSWTGTGKPVRPVFIVVMTIIMMISMLITMRALWQCWLIGTVKPARPALLWSGLHKLCDVLISWADRGSCAHKCVC